jgi:NADH-quinone oxidoreductase subunit J
MPIYEILFWFLSFMAIACALGVIFSRNPVNSVLFLIATFFTISGHYILLNAQFLAIVNIIVYAGAIMVLFLFVIMLMNLNADAEPQKNRLVQVAAVLSGGALFLVFVAALKTAAINKEGMVLPDGENGLVQHLGKVLFTDYVLPFEISSVLFLSAMVGAMVLGRKEDKQIVEN